MIFWFESSVASYILSLADTVHHSMILSCSSLPDLKASIINLWCSSIVIIERSSYSNFTSRLTVEPCSLVQFIIKAQDNHHRSSVAPSPSWASFLIWPPGTSPSIISGGLDISLIKSRKAQKNTKRHPIRKLDWTDPTLRLLPALIIVQIG